MQGQEPFRTQQREWLFQTKRLLLSYTRGDEPAGRTTCSFPASSRLHLPVLSCWTFVSLQLGDSQPDQHQQASSTTGPVPSCRMLTGRAGDLITRSPLLGRPGHSDLHRDPPVTGRPSGVNRAPCLCPAPPEGGAGSQPVPLDRGTPLRRWSAFPSRFSLVWVVSAQNRTDL